MFDRQSQVYGNLLQTADIAVSFVALTLAYFSRSLLVDWAPASVAPAFHPVLLPYSRYLLYLLAVLPIWIPILRITQEYSRFFQVSASQHLFRIGRFVCAAGLAVGFFVFVFNLDVSRPVFFIFIGLSGIFLGMNRILLHWILRTRNVNEHHQVKILVVGIDSRAKFVSQVLGRFRKWGYHVVGHLAPGENWTDVPGIRILGALKDLPGLLMDQLVVDEIIFVGAQPEDNRQFQEVLKLCEELGIRTRIAADFFPTSTSRLSLDFLEELPLITFSTAPDQSVALVVKRIMDCVLASALLALAAPLMLLIMGLIKFTSPGSVFYRQVRRGLYGREFRLLKFRSMVEGAEDQLRGLRHLNEMDGPVFKMRKDPRVTPLGRILRRYSIDELPQLANVLRGEMSLVGPRAPLPEEVRHYSRRQRRRLSVKPGITCLWQISGRNELDFENWMKLDLQYIDQWSLKLDLWILLKTIPAVVWGRGAS